MDFWHSMSGVITLKVLSADVTVFLDKLHNKGVVIYRAQVIDELEIQFQIRRQDLQAVNVIADKLGAQITILSREGIFWRIYGLLHRPVLLIGVILMMLLTLLIPTRVFFIFVEGNQNVPENLIIERAESCGISFGVSRNEIRSEKVKNAVLQAIPQLEWVGINTSGCVATISVRERQSESKVPQLKGVSSIVSTSDGVITQIETVAGNPVVKAGEVVKRGQVLISGYTDCGLSIRATRARGEVYAQTSRELSVVRPTQSDKRVNILKKTKKYSVIIGKNRINFFQGSGILDTSCVKMYEEKYVTLPGGFQLPIAIVTETCIFYDESPEGEPSVLAKERLSAYAATYLQGHLIAGKILSQEVLLKEDDGVLRFEGKYLCEEMIGQERSEEIITP